MEPTTALVGVAGRPSYFSAGADEAFTSTRGTLFSCGQRRRALPRISRSCLLFYKTGPTAFGCPGSGTHDTRERRSAHVGEEAAPQPRRRAQHNGARQFCSTGFGRRGILLPSLCSSIPTGPTRTRTPSTTPVLSSRTSAAPAVRPTPSPGPDEVGAEPGTLIQFRNTTDRDLVSDDPSLWDRQLPKHP